MYLDGWKPQCLKDYHTFIPVGGGSTGTVYLAIRDTTEKLAERPRLPRQVAVKVIQIDSQNNSLTHRVDIELEAIQRLGEHPNIVSVYEAGRERVHGYPVVYIVMEYVEGGTLKNKFQQHRWTPVYIASVCLILVDMLKAMHHIHKNQVMHRDIKPDNILLTDQAFVQRTDLLYRGGVKLADFGIARLWDQPGITADNRIVGTPEYMAPEIALNRPYGPRTDIYAAGCVLYEGIAGRPMFEAEPYSPMAILSQHIHSIPTPLVDINSMIPKELSDIVATMINKSPPQRYATAYTAAIALEKFLRHQGV